MGIGKLYASLPEWIRRIPSGLATTAFVQALLTLFKAAGFDVPQIIADAIGFAAISDAIYWLIIASCITAGMIYGPDVVGWIRKRRQGSATAAGTQPQLAEGASIGVPPIDHVARLMYLEKLLPALDQSKRAYSEAWDVIEQMAAERDADWDDEQRKKQWDRAREVLRDRHQSLLRQIIKNFGKRTMPEDHARHVALDSDHIRSESVRRLYRGLWSGNRAWNVEFRRYRDTLDQQRRESQANIEQRAIGRY